MTNLSLVGPSSSVQVKESITVGTQVAALVTQNNGRGFVIVMIVTGRLKQMSIVIKHCRSVREKNWSSPELNM